MEEEIVELKKELEKSKDELKMRSKYEGNTEALDNMLRKQKNSKDTNGLEFEGQCSNSQDTFGKEIQFTSSSESKEKKIFKINKDTDKKTYAKATRNQPINRYAQNWKAHTLYRYANHKSKPKVDSENQQHKKKTFSETKVCWFKETRLVCT